MCTDMVVEHMHFVCHTEVCCFFKGTVWGQILRGGQSVLTPFSFETFNPVCMVKNVLYFTPLRSVCSHVRFLLFSQRARMGSWCRRSHSLMTLLKCFGYFGSSFHTMCKSPHCGWRPRQCMVSLTLSLNETHLFFHVLMWPNDLTQQTHTRTQTHTHSWTFSLALSRCNTHPLTSKQLSMSVLFYPELT